MIKNDLHCPLSSDDLYGDDDFGMKHYNQQVIHSDLLEIIFEYLPNFFLLSPPMLATWRKVFEINHNDHCIADRFIHQIVSDRLLKKQILEGMTALELLTEIVSVGKNSRGTYPQMLVEKLGLSYHKNEWISLFELLWIYCACGKKYPQNAKQLNLNLKQLLMVNELVARFSPIICMRKAHRSGLDLYNLKIDSSIEFSLLYYEDEKCKFYQQSTIYKYLLNSDWGIDFSKTPMRVRGELLKRNNELVFLPYLNWFSTPTESKKVSLLGCEGYLKLLKSNGSLETDLQEDFLQRYWFKACVGDSELCHSYTKKDLYSSDQVLNLISTEDGRMAHIDGNLNEFFATKFPRYFKHRAFGNAFSKCFVSLSPKTNRIKAKVYPERFIDLVSTIGGRIIVSLLFYWNNWFFNWKYSNQFFEAYNFSIWGKAFFYSLDLLVTVGYPIKALYSLYQGCWLHQHITLLESFLFLTIITSYYFDALKYTYSFRFTPLTWEGSYLLKNTQSHHNNEERLPQHSTI